MNNEQEIIDELQECLDIGDNDRIALYPEEVRMCIDALEKQIAKKPKIYNDKYFEMFDCPNCKQTFDAWEGYSYCPECGQKLDLET